MTLSETLSLVEQSLKRPLSPEEMALVAQMHRANKDIEYIVGVVSQPVDPEPDDDELITTRYEATIAGAQDISGIWG